MDLFDDLINEHKYPSELIDLVKQMEIDSEGFNLTESKQKEYKTRAESIGYTFDCTEFNEPENLRRL